MFIKKMLKIKLFCLCLTVALATCLFATAAQCRVISSVETQDCIQTDSDLNCAKKLVVGVVVSPGLTATVDAVKVIPGTHDEEPQTLEEEVRLEITKTPTTIQYPYTKEFSIDITVIKGDDRTSFSISPADPIYTTVGQTGIPNFNLRAVLAGDLPAYEGEDLVSRTFASRILFKPGEKEIPSITNSLVVLTFTITDLNIIREITNFSWAVLALDALQVKPFQEGARTCDLNVKVQNVGDIEADYIVTVTDLSSNFAMVPAQAITVSSGEESTLTFQLHSDVPLNPDGPPYECRVTLESPKGYIFDETVVDF